MFDFSFGEMVVIGTVALVVIGPERLPKVARTVGAMLARAQRYVNNVKADIQREVELDGLRKLQAEMSDAGRQIMNDVKSGVEEVSGTLHETAREASAALAEPPVPAASVAAPEAVTPPMAHTIDTPPHSTEPVVAVPSAEHQYDLFGEGATVAGAEAGHAATSAGRPERDRR